MEGGLLSMTYGIYGRSLVHQFRQRLITAGGKDMSAHPDYQH